MPVAQQGEQDPVDGLILADDGLADLVADGEESLAQFVVAVGELVLGRQSLVESRLSRARGGGHLSISRNLTVSWSLSVRLARHLPGSWRGRVPRLAGLLARLLPVRLARHLPGGWRVLRRQRCLAGLDPRLAADWPTRLAAWPAWLTAARATGPARLAARPERTSRLSRLLAGLLAGLLRMVGSVGHVGETSLSMAVMRTPMSESCRS